MDIPIGIGDKAVETGLVRRLGKFAVDPGNVFALGDEQTGEVLCEMTALRFVGQQVTKVFQRVKDDLGVFDDSGHG